MATRATPALDEVRLLMYSATEQLMHDEHGGVIKYLSDKIGKSYQNTASLVTKLELGDEVVRNHRGAGHARKTVDLQLTWEGFRIATQIALSQGKIAAAVLPTVELPGAPNGWEHLSGEQLLSGSVPTVDLVADGGRSSDDGDSAEPFYYSHVDPQMVQMVHHLWEQGGDLGEGPADYCPMLGRDLELPSDRVNTLLRRLTVDGVLDRQVKDGKTLWVKLKLDPAVKPIDPNAEPEPEQPADGLMGLEHFPDPSERLIYSKIIEHLQSVPSMGMKVMERLRDITGEGEGAIWRVVKRMDEIGAVVAKLSRVQKEIYLLRLGPLHEGADRKDDEVLPKPFRAARVVSPAAPVEPPAEDLEPIGAEASEETPAAEELVEPVISAEEESIAQEGPSTVTPLHPESAQAVPVPVVEPQAVMPAAPTPPPTLPAPSSDGLDRSLAFELMHALARARQLESEMEELKIRHAEEVDHLQEELKEARSQQQAS